MKRIVLFVFFLLVLKSNGQIIPSSRTVDWSHAGHEGNIPDPAVIIDVATFGAVGDSTTDNYQFILNAINSLGGGEGVIYFPAGKYLISSTLNLPDSVVLRGMSSDSTRLIFDFSGAVGNCMNISGSTNFSFTNVVSGFEKGSSKIVVADVSGFSVNDFAEIEEDNGAWDTHPISWADNSVGQIIHITAVSGDTLFFNHPLRIDYSSSLNVKVRKFIPASEVGIECLNLYRRDNVASGLCLGIYFDHAVNCWVKGVESSRSIGSHIEADASSHLQITGCYIHHAYAYDGTSTHGYGITLFKHAGDCKVENNIMEHLRHSFSMQCGANGNVIAYNYSTDPNRSEAPASLGADISMHGHYTFANLFEGNIVSNIQIDSTWGSTGPFNTFFRNRADLWGIFMSPVGTGSSDSMNFVGNEVTNTGAFLGNYFLTGSGHFEHGNNVRGTITPSGTTTLNDISYYLSTTPGFWNIGFPFPSIGEPTVFGSGSNPAKERYTSGNSRTVCTEEIPTSIVKNDFSEINLFPNPVLNKFEVQCSKFKGKKLLTKITNLLGEELFSKLVVNDDSKSSISVDVSFLSAGVYFLTVMNGSDLFLVRRIVKQ